MPGAMMILAAIVIIGDMASGHPHALHGPQAGGLARSDGASRCETAVGVDVPRERLGFLVVAALLAACTVPFGKPQAISDYCQFLNANQVNHMTGLAVADGVHQANGYCYWKLKGAAPHDTDGVYLGPGDPIPATPVPSYGRHCTWEPGVG